MSIPWTCQAVGAGGGGGLLLDDLGPSALYVFFDLNGFLLAGCTLLGGLFGVF